MYFFYLIHVGTGRGRPREISLTPSVTNYQHTGFWFCLAAASSGMWTINGASMIYMKLKALFIKKFGNELAKLTQQ